MRQLIEDKAEKISSFSTIETFYEPSAEDEEEGTISTMGTIPSSDIKLWGTAYKVTSDVSGRYKYYFYGNFEWLTSPAWELTDKMTIGFPDSYGFYLPTSNGYVTQHQHRYSWDSNKDGYYTDYSIKYTPADWNANAGVAGAYDLIAGEGTHKGYVAQYVYLPTTRAGGSINVKFEYGHKRGSGNPSVTVTSAGLSIVPTTTTDTRSYAVTLNY